MRVDGYIAHSTDILRMFSPPDVGLILRLANRNLAEKRFPLGSLGQHGARRSHCGCLPTAALFVRLGYIAALFFDMPPFVEIFPNHDEGLRPSNKLPHIYFILGKQVDMVLSNRLQGRSRGPLLPRH